MTTVRSGAEQNRVSSSTIPPRPPSKQSPGPPNPRQRALRALTRQRQIIMRTLAPAAIAIVP
jgi:hypothetical protein